MLLEHANSDQEATAENRLLFSSVSGLRKKTTRYRIFGACCKNVTELAARLTATPGDLPLFMGMVGAKLTGSKQRGKQMSLRQLRARIDRL